MQISSLIREDYREKVKDQIREALVDRKPFELVYPIRTASGEAKWLMTGGRAYTLLKESFSASAVIYRGGIFQR